MSIRTPYSGNPAGGGITSPAPGPGVAPIIDIMNDGYIVNRANTWEQPLETVADFCAYNTKVFDGSKTLKTVYIDGYGGRDGYTPVNGALLQVVGDGYFNGNLTVDGYILGHSNSMVDGYMIAAGACGASGGVFDGAGGTSGVYVSGGATVVTTAGGTTTPTPSFHPGTLYADLVPFCIARVSGNGTSAPTLTWGHNILSVSRTGVGAYTVTFKTNAASASRLAAMAVLNTGPLSGVYVNCGTIATDHIALSVGTFGSGLSDLTGNEFTLYVFGGK